MSEQEVSYRVEYTSGALFIWASDYKIRVNIVNRGDTPEHVRVRLHFSVLNDWSGIHVGTDGGAQDTGDSVVNPGDTWMYAHVVSGKEDAWAWIQIFATSPNLVPSASLWDSYAGLRPISAGSDAGDSDQPFEIVLDPSVPVLFFTPGDFAVFSLPIRPEPAPVGPIEAQ